MEVTGTAKSHAILPAKPVAKKSSIGSSRTAKPFKETFESVIAGQPNLQFSNHAIDRLSGQGVKLDKQTVARLTKAVDMAGEKGARQSLVLLDHLAFLVSVKNRTVITALEADRMKEGVFTQIDSAVIG